VGTGLKQRQQERKSGDKTKRLQWIIVISGTAIGIIVNELAPGWGRPIVLTLAVFASVVAFCRPYWSYPFWTVVIGTFALHSSLAFHFRTTINELSLPAIVLCAAAELFVIAFILGQVFPDKDQSPTRR
jgi:4-hydroxybenzoate polyprenyltransferase